jgi:hypothetical protein
MLYGWLSLRVAAGIMLLAAMVFLFLQPGLHECLDRPDIVQQS